ncbi:hypothetical protein ZIOFF_035852 [Zingiber officinale]|uniref:Thioredoxin domain-containing protein n=1 Tax=Zingiber officinale TaxID=94328 RepID=A0A8J5GP20_ZINOF|nr:hypothetical protein ZIOFF_035852 [Zingiber officinale]
MKTSTPSCLILDLLNLGLSATKHLFILAYSSEIETYFCAFDVEILICSSPLCGHCKKLAPEYENLGSSFKKAKSVLIGKVSIVDCDIRAYAANVKVHELMHNKYEQSCRYEGPRTTEALTEFVNTEGGTLQIIFTKNS